MKSPLLLVWLIACLCPAYSLAQSPRFVASSPSREAVLHEPLEINFSLYDADGSNFKPPRFTDAQVLSGPNMAMQTSIINGKVSKTITYSFVLRPTRQGRLSIAPASIQVGGRSLQTQPLSIEVRGAAAKPQGDGEVFIRAEISSRTAYVGQQLLLDYKLYTSKEIESLNGVSEDDYTGFYATEIRQFDSRVLQETLNGRRYFTRILKRMALYPQQQGTLVIDPFSVQMNVPIGDDPGLGFFAQRPVERVPASTQPLEIVVRSLPMPQPAGFLGAVGTFVLESSADPTTLTTDDVIRLRLTVTGQGDLKRVAAPALDLGDAFEVFEPKVLREDYMEFPDRVDGIKEIEYLIVPKRPGEYTLQPVLSYFSPQTQSYERAEATAYPIRVSQGVKPVEQAEEVIVAGENQEFRAAPTQLVLRRAGGQFWATPLFWALGLMPILGLVGVGVFRRRALQREQIDPVLLRQQRARQQASARLEQAARHRTAGDSRAFYDEVSRALLGYVGDKLHISPAELSKRNVQQKLSALAVPPPLVDRFLALMQTCEVALFAGQARADAMENTYEGAVAVLTEIEESLK